jgi:hypothetical protein
MQPKWATVALGALTVAACGGGGGSSGSAPAGVSTTGTTASPQVSLGASAGLSYADFGYWNTATGPANYYASGLLTPATQLPPAGANLAATYTGNYVETHTAYYEESVQHPAGSSVGQVQLTANFGLSSISMRFSNPPLSGIDAGLFPLTGSSTVINGGTFAGIATNNTIIFPIQLTVVGAFYGPSNSSQAPPETAGTFSDNHFGSDRNGIITGSFGAHR